MKLASIGMFLYWILARTFVSITKDVHSAYLKTKRKSSLVSCNSSNDTVPIINNLLAKFAREARELHHLTVSTMHASLESKLLGPRDYQTGIRLQWSGYRDFRPQSYYFWQISGINVQLSVSCMLFNTETLRVVISTGLLSTACLHMNDKPRPHFKIHVAFLEGNLGTHRLVSWSGTERFPCFQVWSRIRLL
jgi:hypothetical protein